MDPQYTSAADCFSPCHPWQQVGRPPGALAVPGTACVVAHGAQAHGKGGTVSAAYRKSQLSPGAAGPGAGSRCCCGWWSRRCSAGTPAERVLPVTWRMALGTRLRAGGFGSPLLSAGSWVQGGVRASWAWDPRGAAEKGRSTGQPKPFPLHMRGTRSSVTQLSPNPSQPHGAEAGWEAPNFPGAPQLCQCQGDPAEVGAHASGRRGALHASGHGHTRVPKKVEPSEFPPREATGAGTRRSPTSPSSAGPGGDDPRRSVGSHAAPRSPEGRAAPHPDLPRQHPDPSGLWRRARH